MNVEEFRNFSFPLCQAHKTFDKVFGVGANKTGTTSLEMVFQATGLKVCPQPVAELAARSLSLGKFQPLKDLIQRFDAFQDVPFSTKSSYAQVDAMFPGSRFILTIRDPEIWFQSFLNHHIKQLGLPSNRTSISADDLARKEYLYEGFRKFKFESDWLLRVDDQYAAAPDWALSFDKDHFINLYEQRNREIVRHFSERPDDLLVIDITREQTTKKIVDFLHLPEKLAIQVPWLNKTAGA